MNSVSVAVASSDSVKQLIREREAILPAEPARRQPEKVPKRGADRRGRPDDHRALQAGAAGQRVRSSGEMVGAGVFSQAARVRVFDVPWLSGSTSGRAPSSSPSLTLTRSWEGRFRSTGTAATFHCIERCTTSTAPRSASSRSSSSADTIFRGMSSASSKVVVFDADGLSLFPYLRCRGGADSARAPSAPDGRILTLREGGTSHAQIAMVASSSQSGWRVAVSQEQRLLLEPVRDFTTIILLFGLLLIAGSIVFAARLSTRLTVPLRGSTTPSAAWTGARCPGCPRQRHASDLDELEELQLAFQDMQRKLRESMDEALEARAHEVQATLLALQSQMDPHFVYNMLTTIGIMAEEGMRGRSRKPWRT